MFEIIKNLGFMAFAYLISAAFIGFSFLKFYEEFRKGVEQKNRLRIWSAFFGSSFVVIFFFTIVIRGIVA